MENPFKTILADEKLPETLKQKVMNYKLRQITQWQINTLHFWLIQLQNV